MYRELLELYYDTEQALHADIAKLARRVLARTEEERQALVTVLEEFFVLQDDGWHNARCDREIAAYHQNLEQKSLAGKASAAKRRAIEKPLPMAIGQAAQVHQPILEGLEDTATPVQHPFNGRSTNQNQNQNHIKPPNPPAGGASGATAFAHSQNQAPAEAARHSAVQPAAAEPPSPPRSQTATGVAAALCAYFPEHRRTRLAEVGALVASLEADGTVTAEQLLKAAAQQAERLGRNDGKACPSVLRWLRERRWLDGSSSGHQTGAIPPGWRDTRSGVEAMGVRLGLGKWDESRHRLFAQYEAAVEAALAATGQLAHQIRYPHQEASVA